MEVILSILQKQNLKAFILHIAAKKPLFKTRYLLFNLNHCVLLQTNQLVSESNGTLKLF